MPTLAIRQAPWIGRAFVVLGLLTAEYCLCAGEVKVCKGLDEAARAQFVVRMSGGYLRYLPPGAPRTGLQANVRPGAIFSDFDGDGRCDAAFVTAVNTPMRVDDSTVTLPFEFYRTHETSLTYHLSGTALRRDRSWLLQYRSSLLLIVHCWDDEGAAKTLDHARTVVLSEYTSPVVVCAFPSRRILPPVAAGDAPLDSPPPLGGDSIHFLDAYGMGNAVLWNSVRKEYRQYPIEDERCP